MLPKNPQDFFALFIVAATILAVILFGVAIPEYRDCRAQGHSFFYCNSYVSSGTFLFK